jgi:hypothetical protein
VQDAGWKANERKHEQKRERQTGVDSGGFPVDGFNLQLTVDERGYPANDECERCDLAPWKIREPQWLPGFAASPPTRYFTSRFPGEYWRQGSVRCQKYGRARPLVEHAREGLTEAA